MMNSITHSRNPFAAAAPTAAAAVPALKIDFGSYYIPKQNSFGPLGEDAFFICKSKNVFGVADGVGAWALEGVDAGDYSRALMANCAAVAEAAPSDPSKILTEGYLKTKYIIGSTTACVIALRNNVLQAANVGDSGFMIFRQKKLEFVSATQQHQFNCPHQLTGGISLSLQPVQAWECAVEVFAGDIIVAGTDGLLDNVFPSEIVEILMEKKRVDSGKLARRLAELALSNSVDRFRTTPFSTEARKAGFRYEGGKIDDITVIVGQVQQAYAKFS